MGSKLTLFICLAILTIWVDCKKNRFGLRRTGSNKHRLNKISYIVACCGSKSCFEGPSRISNRNSSKWHEKKSTPPFGKSSANDDNWQPAGSTSRGGPLAAPEQAATTSAVDPADGSPNESPDDAATAMASSTLTGPPETTLGDGSTAEIVTSIAQSSLAAQSQSVSLVSDASTTPAPNVSGGSSSATTQGVVASSTVASSGQLSNDSTVLSNSSSQPNASLTNLNSSTDSSTTTTTTQLTTEKPKFYIHPDCTPDPTLRNTSYFDAAGTLINPAKFGMWRKIGNNSVLFGKKIGTWLENRLWCYKLGMAPLNLASTAKTFRAWAANWNHGKRFWSFGKIFNGSYGFCPDGSFKGLGWAPNETDTPDLNKECIILNFTEVDDKTSIGFSKSGCSNKSFFACEGSISLPTPAPTYPQYTCAKDLTLFTTLDDERTTILKNPDEHGMWHSLKARNYLFSAKSDKRSYIDALLACCKIGAQLLDLSQDFIYENLVTIMKNNAASIQPDLFWTAGTDEGSEGNFGFASSKMLLPTNAKWATGQPDNLGGKENCLGVDLNAQGYSFKDENCDSVQRYICVAMDTTNSTTGGRRVQRECAANFGINEDDIDSLMAAFTSSGTASSNFKCYIKCIGEMTSLTVGGNLNDAKFLGMLEAMAKDESDLAGKLTGFDDCSNTAGADECDRMAKVHKCGADQSPEFVTNMIQATDASAPLKLSPLPSQIATCPEFTCFVDEKKMLDFKNGVAPNIFYACNKKYLLPKEGTNIYAPVASLCCSHGLKMVSIKSLADFNCLKTLSANFVSATPYAVGVSRLGNMNSPRHCFSTAPFNESLFPWTPTDNTPDYFRVIMIRTAGGFTLKYHNRLSTPICEE